MSASPRILLLLIFLLSCTLVHAAAPPALVTILEGEAALLRGNSKLAVVEGLGLQADDILELSPQTRLLRLEFPDGLSIAFGPGSRVLLAPRLSGERAHAQAYLLSGWAKVNAPKGIKGALLSPALDLGIQGGAAVLALQPGSAQAFAEAGELQLRRSGAAAQTIRNGELLVLADGGKPELATRPSAGFVQAMPRAFMDSLPARAARFQGKKVAPKPLGALTYADAQAWLDAEPALRRAYLPRWRALARDAEFRRGLIAGLKAHPEWEPLLFPPAPPAASKPPAY